jgi:ABC-type lipoprotein export system ATPase subunit
VLDSFDEIVREGTTLLVATHDPRVAGRMRRIIHMRDGALGTEPIPAMPMKLSQSNSAP